MTDFAEVQDAILAAIVRDANDAESSGLGESAFAYAKTLALLAQLTVEDSDGDE